MHDWETITMNDEYAGTKETKKGNHALCSTTDSKTFVSRNTYYKMLVEANDSRSTLAGTFPFLSYSICEYLE